MGKTMTGFYEWFAGLHGFIEFCLVWLVGCTIGCVCKLVYRTINSGLRTIRVWRGGWPLAHLDADGDWKPEKTS